MSLGGADKANLAEVPLTDLFVHVVAMTCPLRGKQGNTWGLSMEPCLATKLQLSPTSAYALGAILAKVKKYHDMGDARTPTESDLLILSSYRFGTGDKMG